MDEELRIELGNCTNHLLHEIADPKMTRHDVAKSYALAMKSSEDTDWARVNRAILARWSQYAVEWIKGQAWSGRCWEVE